MRTLPAEFLAELTKDIFVFKHLFVFEWSKTYYWTDSPENIYYGGNWYESRGISFDSVKLSLNPKIDQITVNIDDVNRKLTKILLSEDVRDKPASIYILPLDKHLQPISTALMIFRGYCDEQGKPIGRKSFSIEIYNDFIKWKRLTPRRVTSPTCIWEFKHGAAKILGSTGSTYTCILDHCGHSSNYPTTGANWATYWSLAGSGGATWVEGDWYTVGTCRYAGAETWCDRSWDRCLALSNTINFGGKRWLPGLVGKQISWGQAADPTTRYVYQIASTRR